MGATIVWFRQDLRIHDNPALWAAVSRGEPIVPVYIWAPEEEGDWPPGGASRWWIHHALASLDESLRAIGSRLIYRRGPTAETLDDLIASTGADTVYWNRRYEPAIIARDTALKAALRERDLSVESYCGALIFEANSLKTKQGNPYQVFTPFWRACLQEPEPDEPLPAPTSDLRTPSPWPDSLALDDLGLLPTIPWDAGIAADWTPGEDGAAAELHRFMEDAMRSYPTNRNRPDKRGTSRMSPYLHHGEISPRQIWHAVKQYSDLHTEAGQKSGQGSYLREVVWREFAHQLLYHFDHTPTAPLREQFERFPWRDDPEALAAWQQGKTGYPLVDAGMRELWHTGWMHNRVRMVVASFLVKDLLISWQRGAEWFWDTLVDADLANNTLGWQWTAGCGADAAPYFRVFNPMTQSKKFDPKGEYIRKWCPELAELPNKHLHAPWEAPDDVLKKAGVTLGKTYPHPMVDHAQARRDALDALAQTKDVPE